MWRWFHWMKLMSVVVHDSHEADSSPDSTDCDLVNDLLDGNEKAVEHLAGHARLLEVLG